MVTVYTKLEVTNQQYPFNPALTPGDMGKAIHGEEITVTGIKEVMYWSDIRTSGRENTEVLVK